MSAMAEAETTLVTILSDCTSFQTYTGSANAAAALTHIYRGALPDPEDIVRDQQEIEDIYPCAMVSTVSFSLAFTAVSNTNLFSPGGVLELVLCGIDDTSLSEAENYEADCDAWSDILDELTDGTGPGGLNITNISIEDKDVQSSKERISMGLQDADSPQLIGRVTELKVLVSWSRGEP